ncbi:MAG TPA: HAD family phosphatase [Bryobacteraceae bacterium]|nr:HAD family phosphatase [Bryobacteraceae bacterium]
MNYLFDLDGTLVDSSPAHAAAFRQAFEQHWPIAGFDYETAKGKRTADVFTELGAPPELLNHLVATKQSAYRELVRQGRIILMPGARDLLEALSAQGERMFLVTSGSRRSVAEVLETTGIRRYFEGIVTSDDVARAKPAPDIYLACIERFDLKPEDCLVIEDAESGFASARAAGLRAVELQEVACSAL